MRLANGKLNAGRRVSHISKCWRKETSCTNLCLYKYYLTWGWNKCILWHKGPQKFTTRGPLWKYTWKTCTYKERNKRRSSLYIREQELVKALEHFLVVSVRSDPNWNNTSNDNNNSRKEKESETLTLDDSSIIGGWGESNGKTGEGTAQRSLGKRPCSVGKYYLILRRDRESDWLTKLLGQFKL